MATNMCPCGTMKSRAHIVRACQIYKKERDALEGEMIKLDVSGMKESCRLESSE